MHFCLEESKTNINVFFIIHADISMSSNSDLRSVLEEQYHSGYWYCWLCDWFLSGSGTQILTSHEDKRHTLWQNWRTNGELWIDRIRDWHKLERISNQPMIFSLDRSQILDDRSLRMRQMGSLWRLDRRSVGQKSTKLNLSARSDRDWLKMAPPPKFSFKMLVTPGTILY